METREPYSEEQCTMGSMWPNCLFCSGMCDERAKDFAQRRKEEGTPEARFVKFYKEYGKWYADVPNHTKEENEMVFGADTLLEKLSEGESEVVVLITEFAIPGTDPIFCSMKSHDDDGALYNVYRNYGQETIGEIWLCNVMHDVTNEHPETFCVYKFSVKDIDFIQQRIEEEKALFANYPKEALANLHNTAHLDVTNNRN